MNLKSNLWEGLGFQAHPPRAGSAERGKCVYTEFLQPRGEVEVKAAAVGDTQLKAQGPSRTCNERKQEEEKPWETVIAANLRHYQHTEACGHGRPLLLPTSGTINTRIGPRRNAHVPVWNIEPLPFQECRLQLEVEPFGRV